MTALRNTRQAAGDRHGTDAGLPRRGTAVAVARPRRAVRGLLCVTALTASLLYAAAPGRATPPPNPSDAQLNAARTAKASLANTVGVLSGQIVQAQAQLRSLNAKVELAEQKFTFALFKLDQAKTQAAQAQTAVATAQKGIETARANLTAFVHDSYVSPSLGSATVGLLSATDPNALLQSGDYRNYVSSRQLDAMSGLDRAIVAKSNADAKARSLLALKQKLAVEAAAAQKAAQQAYANQQALAAQLRTREASYQRQLADAQSRLATLNGQRAAYLAYQQEQARIAAERARQAALARQRAEEAAARARAEAERQRREQEKQQQQQSHSNSGGGNSGGSTSSGGGYNPPPSGGSGSWTASKGQAAANRALGRLGTPYAWAGGNYNGPTWGVDSPGTDGAHDSQVFGFDCSGLTMYAWAPQGEYLDHFAASQYWSGSFHPQPGQFMPGDLLFWSDGGLDAIHHVALYIGGGNVVQAPHSGDVVRVTPWDQVSWGYIGATRPLT
ncbi:NlpC/P60 family protein [Jatrophihabitans sp.]|uniref:C40 family peptidase n=1 Tax=Jatrophihabitans sp. TaxID=1932789 RepID=UPI0038CDB4AE